MTGVVLDKNGAARGIGLAILDQALFAGSGSLILLILGRLVSPQAFGALVLAYTLTMLLGQLQSAVFSEPMSVLGPSRFQHLGGGYHRAVELHSVQASLVGAVLLAVGGTIAWLRQEPELARALAGGAVALPPLLAAWLRRRALYIAGRLGASVRSSAAFLATSLAGIALLKWAGQLGAFSGLALLGAASLVALVLSPLDRGGSAPDLQALRSAHWDYGRWAILTALLGWSGNLYYFLISSWHGLAEAGALRAIMNFVYPMIQVNQAISILLLPRWARVGPSVELSRQVRGSLLGWAAFAGGAWGGMALAGPLLVGLVYGDKYQAQAGWVAAAFALPLTDGLTGLLVVALRATGKPRSTLWSSLPIPAMSMTLGAWLTATYAMPGAIGSMLLASGLALVIALTTWRRRDVEP